MKKIWCSIMFIIIGIILFLGITYNSKERKMLQEVINYKVMDINTYTPSSYALYTDALNEAILISNKYFVSKEDINITINNLQTKIDNLYVRPNKDILKNKYNSAIELDLNLYLPNSTLNIKSAIKSAYKVINDDNAVIVDVNNAINMIDNSINQLIFKPDKTILNNLITTGLAIEEDNYTKETYDKLKISIKNASIVLNDVNAMQKDVDEAISLIKEGLDNLVILRKGLYKITYSVYMISNNHVGNEWGYSIFYNSNEFENGDLLSGNIDSYITLYAEIYEFDKIMDYGTNSINLMLQDGYQDTIEVIVKENCGRYYGNVAKFKINYFVELVDEAY